jgi:hypothetical protein
MRLSVTIVASLVVSAAPLCVHAEDCGRDAFAAVVGKAGAELTSMNDANKKNFHEKLQLLKTRKGWADADYVAQATPFIQDERIAALDTDNAALLAKVPQLGSAAQTTQALASMSPSMGGAPDGRCAMLDELRGLMAKVVGNTQAKWSYMFGKIDSALNDARQADAAR